jgi:tRNA dimethylallyltransferase
MASKNILFVVVGPTAVGKTDICIELAQEFNIEILSADSRQFFKELKIGTACPTDEQLKKAPHHFIGHLPITAPYSVADFEKDAINTINKIYTKQKQAILTGGSGLYINAVCKGFDELPAPDQNLRDELNSQYKRQGIEWLQKEVQSVDPDFFNEADIYNPQRLMRALEVFLSTRKPFSSFRKGVNQKRDFNIFKIGINRKRDELYDRINKRVETMMEEGLVEEVKDLFEFRHLNALQTVGYKEIFEFLDNKTTLDKAVELIKRNTRRYAKRQLTWFRKDPEIQWFHPEEKEKIFQQMKKIAGGTI